MSFSQTKSKNINNNHKSNHIKSHLLIPRLASQLNTQIADIFHGWIQGASIPQRSRRPRQLPHGILLFQAFANPFLGLAATYGPGIHPTLQHGTGMGLDCIGGIGSNIECQDEADTDGTHAYT